MFCHLARLPVNHRHHSLPSSDGFTFENDAVQKERPLSRVGITFRAQHFQLTQRDGGGEKKENKEEKQPLPFSVI